MPLKIVYLDDEPHLCEMFVDNFESSEVSVQTFTESRAAIKAINESTPDLVFLDYRLPGMTGDDVASLLNSAVPLALLTGDLSVKTVTRFVRIFHKPFNFDEMEAFIQSYLKK